MRFTLSGTEARNFVKWNEFHLKTFHNGVEPEYGAIGGRVTYELTPTSIGTVVKVRCACGHGRGDITDYEMW